MTEENIIGKSVPRKEGRDKVTGAARYIDDMTLPGMLYGATVRSQIPRGSHQENLLRSAVRLERICHRHGERYSRQELHRSDRRRSALPGGRKSQSSRGADSAAGARRTASLRKAVDAVTIEYEPLPAIFTIEESERAYASYLGNGQHIQDLLIDKGEVDGVWSKADYIVEGEYTTGAQEQLYIENNGVIAAFDREQGITVWGSLQCPYYVHKALMALCACRKTRFASCKWKPAAPSAARKIIPRSSPATRRFGHEVRTAGEDYL
jgi:CO/xanthine dehydrogenase Mo-binding subunit